MRCLAFFLLALLLAGPAAAQPRLRSQRVLGAERLCVYPNPDTLQRRAEAGVTIRVGISEPCPLYYPGPTRARPAERIPSMATLVRQRFENGMVICDYDYLGRRYSRARRMNEMCPYTAHFDR
ncbi:MAG TPA: hypothetical protein VEC11_06385 [Allosphingosinicella sp.]|nr:hypothetical protein [Allosphingosinicella sp.]